MKEDIYENYGFELHSGQKDIVELLEDDKIYGVLAMCSRQFGKSLIEGTGILTPTGSEPIETLKIGDVVLNPQGGGTSIIDITPVYKNFYQITTTYGRTITTDGSHINVLWDRSKKKYEERTTSSLLNLKNLDRFTFPNNFKISHIENNNLPLEPFYFGQWLVSLTRKKHYNYKNLYENNYIMLRRDKDYNIAIPKFDRENLLFRYKEYLYNSNFIISEVVRGIETSISHKRIRSSVDTDKVLKIISKFLQALGYKTKIIKSKYKFNYELSYCIYRESIKNIEFVGKKHGRCLTLTSENGQYITDQYIVTHNSTLSSGYMYKMAMSCKETKVLYVSPTFDLCREQISKYVDIKDRHNPVWLKNVNQSAKEVTFINGSKIYFRSAAQRDSLRGLNAHFMVIDEAAYIQKDFIEDVLFPMMTTIGKKIFMISTPNSFNWFYSYFVDAQPNQKLNIGKIKWESIKKTYKDNPMANIDWVESQQQKMPKVKFEQEYLCEFNYDSNVFNDLHETFHVPTQKPQKLYVGIDIGMRNDYTAIAYMDENCKLQKIFYKRNFNDFEDVILYIQGILKQNPFEKALVEKNNFGIAVYERLQLNFGRHKILDWTTTNKNKEMMILDLIVIYENNFRTQDELLTIYKDKNKIKKLKLINDDELVNHFNDFQIIQKNNMTGYTHRPGKHDDIVISCALVNQLIKRESKKSTGKMFLT